MSEGKGGMKNDSSILGTSEKERKDWRRRVFLVLFCFSLLFHLFLMRRASFETPEFCWGRLKFEVPVKYLNRGLK